MQNEIDINEVSFEELLADYNAQPHKPGFTNLPLISRHIDDMLYMLVLLLQSLPSFQAGKI